MANEYLHGLTSFADITSSVQGWINHVRYRDTVVLWKALLRKFILPPSQKENRYVTQL